MPTRRKYSIKALLCFLSAAVVLAGQGCGHRKTETAFTLSEWITEVTGKAGIEAADPFEAAREWDLLAGDMESDDPLTRETAAFTLAHLYGEMPESVPEIPGLEECRWPQEVSLMVGQGWMETDRDGRFHPGDRIGKEEALRILGDVVYAADHRSFAAVSDIRWNNGEAPADLSEAEFIEEMQAVRIGERDDLQEGDVVFCTPLKDLYRIISVDRDAKLVYVETASLQDTAEQYEVSGESDLDFQSARIEEEGEQLSDRQSTGGPGSPLLHPYTRTFTVRGFQIRISTAGTSVRAEAFRTLEHGSRVSAALAVNDLHLSYRLKKKDMESAYFRITFRTAESASLRRNDSADLYSDFSRYDKADPLGSLRQMFAEKKDVVESQLTLCTITLPVSGTPGVTLKMALELHIYASGRIELTLTQDHTVGCEIRDGKVRMIRSCEKDGNAVLRADAALTAGVRTALCLFGNEMMDAAVETGVKGVFSTTVHRYDENGKVTSSREDLSPDFAEEFARSVPGLQVCTDLNAWWVLNLRVNSRKTAAGKLGLSARCDILSQKNAPLFPGMPVHLEHFQAVSACTIKDAVYMKRMDELETKGLIVLETYSTAVKEGETAMIRILSLPEGTERTGLIYESSDPGIVSVSPDGTITGNHYGAAIITVMTHDKSERASCHVMVTRSE